MARYMIWYKYVSSTDWEWWRGNQSSIQFLFSLSIKNIYMQKRLHMRVPNKGKCLVSFLSVYHRAVLRLRRSETFSCFHRYYSDYWFIKEFTKLSRPGQASTSWTRGCPPLITNYHSVSQQQTAQRERKRRHESDHSWQWRAEQTRLYRVRSWQTN